MKKVLSILLIMMLMVGALAACNKNGGGEVSNGGAKPLTEVTSTAFFDFTIMEAYTASSFETRTAAEGNEMLVVRVKIENTFGSTIPMSDMDFQAQWGDDAEDAYAYPITLNMEDGSEIAPVSDKQLPYEYEMTAGEVREGLLVYEVPAGHTEFSISTVELYSDGSEGETYFVYFDAEKK